MADFKKEKDWLALKKKYKIPNGAVKGIQMEKALKTFHAQYDSVSGPTASRKRVVIAEALEKQFAAYISALSKDKKEHKLYAGFEKEILNDYLGKINFLANDLKRYDADAKLYQAELAKYFHAVHKLDADKASVTKEDLEYFNQGPQRGLSALGKSVKKVDPRKIDAALGLINTAIQTAPKEMSQEELTALAGKILEWSEAIATEGRALGLLK